MRSLIKTVSPDAHASRKSREAACMPSGNSAPAPGGEKRRKRRPKDSGGGDVSLRLSKRVGKKQVASGGAVSRTKRRADAEPRNKRAAKAVGRPSQEIVDPSELDPSLFIQQDTQMACAASIRKRSRESCDFIMEKMNECAPKMCELLNCSVRDKEMLSMNAFFHHMVKASPELEVGVRTAFETQQRCGLVEGVRRAWEEGFMIEPSCNEPTCAYSAR